MAFCTCRSRCNLRPKIYLSGYLISSPLTSQGPKLLGTAEPEALLLFLPLFIVPLPSLPFSFFPQSLSTGVSRRLPLSGDDQTP